MQTRSSLSNNIIDFSKKFKMLEKSEEFYHIEEWRKNRTQRKKYYFEELGQMLKISKERVRQIETKALIKLKTAILDISQQNKEFFI